MIQKKRRSCSKAVANLGLIVSLLTLGQVTLAAANDADHHPYKNKVTFAMNPSNPATCPAQMPDLIYSGQHLSPTTVVADGSIFKTIVESGRHAPNASQLNYVDTVTFKDASLAPLELSGVFDRTTRINTGRWTSQAGMCNGTFKSISVL